ncbi:MAG: hypothetical protein RLZZ524_2908 [Pseudomonadota bacterium]|jgi:hypothetical protein
MKELVFLLEEESARALLQALVPRLLPVDGADLLVRFQVFEGKQDLERNIERRLRAWQNPQARFIVLRDQDSHPDCRVLKAGLVTRCTASGKQGRTLVRLACRELETFYLADLQVVGQLFGLADLGGKQASRKYRAPDALESPSRELRQLTHQRYQKVAGSRELGAVLHLDNQRSPSFAHLVTAIRRQVQALLQHG